MKTIIISIKYLLLMTIVTGLIYPLLMFGFGKIFFPKMILGNIIYQNENPVGSEIIGQNFVSSKYFHPRPSAVDYQTLPSSGSNLAPTSTVLKNNVDSLRTAYILNNGLVNNVKVPEDAIFTSASGLDPHISFENAMLQVNRIVKERNFNNEKKSALLVLVNNLTENPQFGFLGEKRIKLNLELDKL